VPQDFHYLIPEEGNGQTRQTTLATFPAFSYPSTATYLELCNRLDP
jgi:hypothetical protein